MKPSSFSRLTTTRKIKDQTEGPTIVGNVVAGMVQELLDGTCKGLSVSTRQIDGSSWLNIT